VVAGGGDHRYQRPVHATLAGAVRDASAEYIVTASAAAAAGEPRPGGVSMEKKALQNAPFPGLCFGLQGSSSVENKVTPARPAP
jgi:hypothetical protein